MVGQGIRRNSFLAAALLCAGITCNQVGGIYEAIPRECLTDNDCLLKTSACIRSVVCEDTICKPDFVAAGPISSQKDGDCGTLECDGLGQLRLVPHFAENADDAPDDGNPCTLDICIGTTPRHLPMTDMEIPCYTGPAMTRGIGICKDGFQRCDGTGKPMGGCTGQVLPRSETCISSLDEDCDGASNEEGEGCKCVPGETRFCYTGPEGTQDVGICHSGQQACRNDGLGYGACDDQPPMSEVCDVMMLDEDCNGQSNEGGVCICGDGVVSAGEHCDDGNTQDGDTCPHDCRIGAVQIWAGGRRTCVLLDNGLLKCWGDNTFGGLPGGELYDHQGDASMEMGKYLPAIGIEMMKVVRNGTMGWDHTCAVFNDDSMKCWGYNWRCQCGKRNASCADIWGYDQSLQNEPIDSLPFVDITPLKVAAAGWAHSCAVTAIGAVRCWGDNASGQVGVGAISTVSSPGALPAVQLGVGKVAKAIAAGGERSCALLNDDTVKCWGSNAWGALGIDGGNRGTKLSDMGDALPSIDLGTNRKPVALAVGAYHSCALTDDGRVLCWGANSYGQLGLGDTTSRYGSNMGNGLPSVDLGTGRTAMAVSAGAFHTCTILDDGSIKCWGAFVDSGTWAAPAFTPFHPIIGDAPNEMGDALMPLELGLGRRAIAMASGNGHMCAILDDRSVKCWGIDKNGSLGRGAPDGYFTWTDDVPTVELW